MRSPFSFLPLFLRGPLAAMLVLGPIATAHAQAPAAPRITPPVVVEHVDAEYPPALVAARKHADVVLAVTVDAEGHVSKVDVKESGGDELDAAAIEAVRKWTFRAGTKDGVPFPMRISVPFHFSPPAMALDVPQSQTSIQAGTTGSGSGTSSGASTPPSAAAAPTSPSGPAEPAESVTVRGKVEGPSRGASDYKIETRDLASRIPRKNASDLLKLAPGVFLANEGGEGHAEQVFMRGFDARDGQDVEFTVGNIPINEAGNLHGSGYADTHFIIPELVTSLRVVEGPFDPRQGNFAVAGSADYELGLDRRGFTAKYTGGSWNTQRLVLLFGPREESEHTFAGVDVGLTDGFGQNRAAKHGSAMAQYEGKLGERGMWKVTATGYTTQFQTPGVIRQDDYVAGRKGFYDTYDARQGGSSARFGLAGDIQTRAGSTTLVQRVFITARSMRLLENFTGFVLDDQSPQRGDLLDLHASTITFGAKGAARWHTKALGERQDVEVGYFARGDATDGTQNRLDTLNNPYKADADLGATLGDLGAYADLSLRASSWLGVRGGARADVFTFDIVDRTVALGQRTTSSSLSFFPRATLLVGPFKNVTFSASYGQGARSADPADIAAGAAEIATVDAYEGGVSYTGGFGNVSVGARSVLFATHVDHDLVFSETAGREVSGLGTTRTGWAGSVNVMSGLLHEVASVTWVRAVIDGTHETVPYVPPLIARDDTVIVGALPIKIGGDRVTGAAGLGLSFLGNRPLPYGASSDPIFTVDASLSAAWRNYELGVSGVNLTDQKIRLTEFNYVSDFHLGAPSSMPARHFTTGTPLGVFATLTVRFGDR